MKKRLKVVAAWSAAGVMLAALLGMLMPMWTTNIKAEGIDISEEYFPDSAFRQYLSDNWDTADDEGNKDGKLSVEELNSHAVISIDGNDYAIENLAGTEYLTNLRNITLTNVDMETLTVKSSTLMSLMLTNMSSLYGIDCSECTSLSYIELNGDSRPLLYANISDSVQNQGILASVSSTGYIPKTASCQSIVLPTDFDVTKIVEGSLSGAEIVDGTLVPTDFSTEITYTYSVNSTMTHDFKILVDKYSHDFDEDGFCTDCGCDTFGLELEGYSASLSNETNLEMYLMQKDATQVADVSDLSASISNCDYESTVAYADWTGVDLSDVTGLSADSGKTVYRFSSSVYPKNIDENVSFVITDGTNSVTYTESVKDYAEAACEASSDTATKNLLNAMMDYGLAAKVLLDNCEITDAEAEQLSNLKKVRFTSDYAPNSSDYSLDFWGASLSLDETMGIYLYFKKNDDYNDSNLIATTSAKKLQDGQKMIYPYLNGSMGDSDNQRYAFAYQMRDNSDTYFELLITGIYIQNIDIPIAVEVDDKSYDTQYEMAYSIYSYAAAVQNANTNGTYDNLLNVMYALYQYNYAADVYCGNTPVEFEALSE